LRILAALQQDFPPARLIITGPLGPHNPANMHYFQTLTALQQELKLQNSVLFLAEQTEEHIPDAVIADFYRLADALLLPSREEGFGIPILEAGLAGLPIFCTGIPPLKDLGGEEATYFSPDAEPALVAQLIADRLQADRTYRLRVRVRSSYNWQNIYQRHIAPLLEV
jgi:glycosyltransferase involved in cell wall biosynthesis